MNLTNIRSIELPVPPLREQRCIIAYLDDLQAKVEQPKTLQAPTAAELDTLIPSIPDGAFPGGVYATPCPAPNVSAEARQVVFKRPGLDDLKVGWIDFAETRKIVARWPDL